MKNKVLLLGGNGFLGKGLQNELQKRNIYFKSLDLNDADLSTDVGQKFLKLFLKENDYDNIVILASKIGAILFNSEPYLAANYNKILYNNIVQSCFETMLNENKHFSITFYSTSECFGSLDSIDDVITDKSMYKFNLENPRYLYSYNKYLIENKLFDFQKAYPDLLQSIKILRPFNVFGRNQQRGVIYNMLFSGITTQKIYYSKNTTRTFTDIDLASKMSVDKILSNKNCKANIVDNKNSLSMKSLANIINDILTEKLNIKSDLIELPIDTAIQYRHTSKPDSNIEEIKNNMKNSILELISEIQQYLKQI